MTFHRVFIVCFLMTLSFFCTLGLMGHGAYAYTNSSFNNSLNLNISTNVSANIPSGILLPIILDTSNSSFGTTCCFFKLGNITNQLQDNYFIDSGFGTQTTALWVNVTWLPAGIFNQPEINVLYNNNTPVENITGNPTPFNGTTSNSWSDFFTFQDNLTNSVDKNSNGTLSVARDTGIGIYGKDFLTKGIGYFSLNKTPLSINQDFTWGTWIKINNSVANAGLFDISTQNAQATLSLGGAGNPSCTGAGSIAFFILDNNAGGMCDVGGAPLNSWIFVVAVHRGSMGELWVNGTLTASNNHQGSQSGSITRAEVARGGASVVFDGEMDNVFVVQRALSADEIIAMFNAVTSPAIPPTPSAVANSLIVDKYQALSTDTLNVTFTANQTNGFNQGINASIKFNGTFLSNSSFVYNASWDSNLGVATNVWYFNPVFLPNPMTVNNTTIVFNASLTFNSITTDNFNTTTITEYNPTLGQCGNLPTIPSVPSIGFFTYNETDNTNGTVIGYNTTVDSSFKLYLKSNSSNYVNISFELVNNTKYYICMYPTNMTLFGDADIMYNPTLGGNPRNYYLRNSIISNSSTEIDLFTLASNLATRIIFQVQDTNRNVLNQYILKIQKYFLGSGTYQMVAMTQSDFNGQAISYLNLFDTRYKITAWQGNQLKSTYDVSQLKCSDVTNCQIPVIVNTTGGIQYLRYSNSIADSCSYDNSTLRLTCTFADTSGLTNQFCLNIKDFTTLGVSNVPSPPACVSTSAGSISYTFGSYNQSKVYNYQLIASTPGLSTNQTVIDGGTIQFFGQNVLGNDGVFVGFIVIGTIAFLGVFSPMIGIILIMMATGFLSYMGLINIPVGGLVALSIVGLIIIWRSRTKGE